MVNRFCARWDSCIHSPCHRRGDDTSYEGQDLGSGMDSKLSEAEAAAVFHPKWRKIILQFHSFHGKDGAQISIQILCLFSLLQADFLCIIQPYLEARLYFCLHGNRLDTWTRWALLSLACNAQILQNQILVTIANAQHSCNPDSSLCKTKLDTQPATSSDKHGLK